MAIDWTKSMRQSFEYYTVDPYTWRDRDLLKTITACTIDRDESSSTLGSASIDMTESLNECYVRVYLVANQNGETDKYSLGTFLVQTPSVSFNGRVQSITADAYTPLIELKEKKPPIGYTVRKKTNIVNLVTSLCKENMRAPVIATNSSSTASRDFVAGVDDTWLEFLADLLHSAEFSFDLDTRGNVSFSPQQDVASLQPIWTYNDGNSSILYPDISINRDLYSIPNVVEVLYSGDSTTLFARAVNDDPNSLISTVGRGREIIYRVSNLSLLGTPTQGFLNTYAKQLLRNMSAVEYSLTYSHGYCPVRIGDCVRLNYPAAGLQNVKAKVVSQSITCKPGTPVSETAVFTKNL